MKTIECYVEDTTLYTPLFCTMQKDGNLRDVVVLMGNFDTDSQCRFVQELGRRHGVFVSGNEKYTDFCMDFGKYLMVECLSFDWWQDIQYIFDAETGVIEIAGEDFGFYPTLEEQREEMMAEFGDFWMLGLC